ncbi:MAG: hypothetical protein PVI92_17260 [Chromatiales bacterium]|jgi:hypothetical protein
MTCFNVKPIFVGLTITLFMLSWSIAGFADEISGLRQVVEQLNKLEAEKKEDDFKHFEFHGYSRAGFAWNQGGSTGKRYRWNYGASVMTATKTTCGLY